MNTAYVYQSAQIGEFRPAILYGTGPANYLAAGDPVANPGAAEYIAFPSECWSKSGNYQASFFPTAVGNGQVRAGAASASASGWTARYTYSGQATNYKVVTSPVIANAGTGYTAGTYVVTLSGGSPTRAATITLVVNASQNIATATILDPGIGYNGSTPTVPLTALGAGSSGSVTVSLSAATPGAEVAAGTNLSGETFQFGSLVTQL